jgi:hypothetical protein
MASGRRRGDRADTHALALLVEVVIDLLPRYVVATE